MVKVVPPVLLALALATPASARPTLPEILQVHVARCQSLTVALDELGYPEFTVCRSLQQ